MGPSRLLIVMAVCLASIGMVCASCIASDAKAQIALQKQQECLSRLHSLRFSCALELTIVGRSSAETTASGNANSSTIANRFVFACKGDKFRGDVTILDDAGRTLGRSVHAYDGQYYQIQYREGGVPTRSKINKDSSRYGTVHPLLLAYSFLFWGDDIRSIGNLQSKQTWSRLAARITSAEDCEMDGHAGVKLNIVGPVGGTSAGKLQYSVFLARDLSYFPIYWKLVYPNGRVGEYHALATKTIGGPDAPIVVPLRVFTNEHKDGKEINHFTLEVDPASLEVNPSIDDALFTLEPRPTAGDARMER